MSKKQEDKLQEDDIILEEDFSEDSHVDKKYQNKIKKLQEDLQKCKTEKANYLDGWQRAQADFINYKKQNDSVFLQAKETATIHIVESLLPILDAFDMALQGEFDDSFKKWLTGFEYVHQQFKRVLEENNIEEINPLNQKFSPEHHEAVAEIPIDDKSKDYTVAQVILKGYKNKKKIIRAAQVKVYKFEE